MPTLSLRLVLRRTSTGVLSRHSEGRGIGYWDLGLALIGMVGVEAYTVANTVPFQISISSLYPNPPMNNPN